MPLTNLPLVFLILFNIVLAFFILFNNRKALINVTFFSLIITLTLWVFGNFLIDNSTDVGWVKFWVGFSYAIGILISFSLVLFALTFSEKLKKLSIPRLILLSIPAIVTSILSFSDLVAQNVRITKNVVEFDNGVALPGYLLVFVGYLGFASYLLYKSYRQGNAMKKLQLEYFLFGTLLTAGLVVVLNFILPLIFNTYVFATYTPYSTLIMLGSISYAIVRHRLLDIRLVVARTVAYVLLVTVLFGFFVVSTIIATSIFVKTPTPINQVIIYSALAIVVGYAFGPLRDFFEKITDKIFFKEKYNSSELLLNLTKVMATTLGLNQLQGGILERLLPEMRLSKGAFVLTNKGKVENIKALGFDEEAQFSSSYVSTLVETGKILLIDEIGEGEHRKILRELDVSASIPLKVGPENELGILLLGHKLSGEIYTNQDITLLNILEPEISVAIQNAKAYEEIKNFNITLQEEIRKATSELRDANERLKELDQLKDEFLSIASHELRTPMTAIKSYVWLALHGKAGKLNKIMQDYLGKVYSSSERMIALINDMLNVSRIETGRLQMDLRPVSVYKVADQVFGDLAARSTETGVKLILNKENPAPPVMADTDKLAEIYTNLIGNSLKFTKPGGTVTIKAEKKEKMIQVSVQDTGVGIAKENLNKLFQKYGKLGDSYATMAASSSSGTGLGLYITKQYIEKMGGTIKVESTLGKGTTFTFTLPLATTQDLKAHPESEPQPQGIFINPQMAGQFGISPAFIEAQKKEMAKNEKKNK